MQNAIRVATSRAQHRVERGRRLAPLAAAIALCFSCGATATTIVVNDASDDSVLGKCTLVDAAAALNGAVAVNACAAGNGSNDTIDLSFFTQATTISLALPNSADGKSGIGLTKPATISGPLGSDGKPLVTIRRSATSGVNFRVIGTSADLTLQGVNVTGGAAHSRGAGVYASGTANLTITSSMISGNSTVGNVQYSGGGVSAIRGSITLNSSNVSGNTATKNGGGIYGTYDGAITLTNSTVTGNSAYYSGGGIYSFTGSVIATSSTVNANHVGFVEHYNGMDYQRGGLSGGGIFGYKKVMLTNSTVSGNSARYFGGGVYLAGKFYNGRPGPHPSASPYQTGNAYLYFSTITGNTNGGVKNPNYIKSIGSIIYGNVYGDLDLAPVSGPAVQFVGSNNLIHSPPPQAPLDTIDCDPKLAPLASNGGPTLTMGLLIGSCAIDAGPTVPLEGILTDQRGLGRPVGAATDIGAFEKQNANDPPPDEIFASGFDT